jgi:hypothetical protein
MMSSTPFKVLTALTGIVIAGEALALAVGMHILSPADNRWISLKNDLFLGLDVIVGLGLVLVAAVSRRVVPSGILCVLVFSSVVARGYRELEYLIRTGNAFCANAPLFVLNNLKLIGLLAVAASVVGSRITSRS